MKNLLKITIIFVAILFTSCELADRVNQADDARAFNDSIVGQQTRIVRCILDMCGEYEGDITKAEQFRKEGIGVSGSGIRKVEIMKTSNEEQLGFKNASLGLFRFYRDILAKESKEIITILGKDSVTESDLARIEEIDADISAREKTLDSIFQKAQEAFAKKYGVLLQDNPMQTEIDSL